MTIVRLTNWQEKMKLIKNKHNLKQTDIYIDNDTTTNEREIQRQLRQYVEDGMKKYNIKNSKKQQQNNSTKN